MATNTIKVADLAKVQPALPVWGATHEWIRAEFAALISIHAPRVGSDRYIS